MATAPVKSQPLHNFSLSFLKWGNKNQMNNHRCRRPVDPPHPPPPQLDNRSSASSEPDSDGGGGSEPENNCKPPVGSRSSRNRFAFSSCSLREKSQKRVVERESGEVDDEEREKGDEVEESSVQKPWNLRPRRGVSKGGAIEVGGGGGGSSRNGELQEMTVPAVQQSDNNLPKSLRLRGFAGTQGMERKEKLKFWISLSKEEIEEDVFVMTGSKPARRPRKRPRTVQKQLDNVFPGLWLVGVTADSYRIPEAPAKR
ncbi:hypothetical protein L1049_022035 [Liquidambar formosana]|uniref:DUF1639 family protein n=1 Tax=Liquidambar formosana TaxID=63359 RepID=A0AAP0RDU0_LIQFO